MLSPGIELNGAVGELSGDPTEAGTSTFTIKASNGQSPEAVTPTLTIKVAA
jgi:Putative Ig domain